MNLTPSLGVSASTFAPDAAPAAPPAVIAAPKRRGKPKGSKNYGTLTDYTAFVIWATKKECFPTIDQVRERYGCAKATAARWLEHLVAAGNREDYGW